MLRLLNDWKEFFSVWLHYFFTIYWNCFQSSKIVFNWKRYMHFVGYPDNIERQDVDSIFDLIRLVLCLFLRDPRELLWLVFYLALYFINPHSFESGSLLYIFAVGLPAPILRKLIIIISYNRLEFWSQMNKAYKIATSNIIC